MQEQETAITFVTESPEQTEALGALLGRLLGPGDIVTLSGELGGGKTCFVRGVVSSAAPEALDMVASPTFAILNEYPGACQLLHYDCYRLHNCHDAIELGLEDHLGGSGICLIEWPDRISQILPDNRVEIIFEYAGETQRRIVFLPFGAHAEAQLMQLVEQHNKPIKKACLG